MKRERYVWSVVLFGPTVPYGESNIVNQYGVCWATSRDEAAAKGLRYTQKNNPRHGQIVGLGAILLSEAIAHPIEDE